MRKENNNCKISFVLELLTKVYTALMVGLLPLFYTNHYFDILESKAYLFKVVTVPFVMIGLVLFFIYLIKKIKAKDVNFSLKNSLFDILILGLILVVIISCILSAVGVDAFIGKGGRRLGGFTLLLSLFGCFLISHWFKLTQGFVWIFLLVNSLQWLVVALQLWNIDPLGMGQELSQEQVIIFMGTIGNINFIAGYTCVVLAIIMVFYIQCEGRLSNICYGIAMGLGMYAGFVTRSDSFILGFGISVFLICCFSIDSSKKLKKLGWLWFVFLIVTFLLKLSLELVTAYGTLLDKPIVLAFRKEKLFVLLTDWKIIFIQMLGLLLWFFLCSKYKKKYEKNLKIVLFCLAFGAFVVACIQVLPLQDSFGNGRARIWRITWEEFQKLPFIFKIFGYGPNSFYQFLSANRAEELVANAGSVFIDPHNELLYFLSTTGIAGVFFYFAMQIMVIFDCCKKIKRNPAYIAGVIAVLVFMAQGLVNNPQAFITPLFFIMLGIFKSSRSSEV